MPGLHNLLSMQQHKTMLGFVATEVLNVTPAPTLQARLIFLTVCNLVFPGKSMLRNVVCKVLENCCLHFGLFRGAFLRTEMIRIFFLAAKFVFQMNNYEHVNKSKLSNYHDQCIGGLFYSCLVQGLHCLQEQK